MSYRMIKNLLNISLFPALILMSCISKLLADPIYHETKYPPVKGIHPAVVVLHTSSGFKTVKRQMVKYSNAGYVVYAPDFFRRHGISMKNRFKTWTTHRTNIETELIEIIELIKKDPLVDPKNIFAVGFSNGGYWASFLAARKHVNAAASHYGVWRWPPRAGWIGYPADYFDEESNPVLAIHGDGDTIQKPKFVYGQLDNVEVRSPKFKKHIFSNAGHSWDCKRCSKDGYNKTVTKLAFEMTLGLFERHRR